MERCYVIGTEICIRFLTVWRKYFLVDLLPWKVHIVVRYRFMKRLRCFLDFRRLYLLHFQLRLLNCTVQPLLSGQILSGHPPLSATFQSPDIFVSKLLLDTSIQRPPLLRGHGHLFAVTSVLFIWFFTSIKRPANYLSKQNGDRWYKVITENNKKTRTAGLRNLSTMFCIFFSTLSTKRNTVHFNYVPSVLELELCIGWKHLMFCYNEFWIYLHICSLFKSILLYRVIKIMVTAIPTQFILYLY